jgi:hypothetical protein
MNTTTKPPKVFISYSWTNAEHEQFVLELATSLRTHGVDAVLDKWDLKPGQDKFVFMESMVVDPEVGRVLVICDRKYQEKANSRAGGVGTESQIISQEVYGKVNQTKFIPIVCEYDEDDQPCLPIFMKGRIYIDMSTDERYGAGLDELLRQIYEQPFHEKPKLGAAPAFLTNGGTNYVKELGAAVRAIHDGKANRQGLEGLFTKSLLFELQKGYVTPDGQDYDEGVHQAIAATKGLRDQLSEYVDAVAGFSGDDPKSLVPFQKLMEGVAANFGPPEANGTFYPGWSDYYTFFALEAFLIQTAALIRHSCWMSLRRLLDATYLVRGSQRELRASTFVTFDPQLDALDKHRNQRLNLHRRSVSADVLKERCSPERTNFQELMQADVLLTLRGIADNANSSANWQPFWAPRTSVYASYGNKFPLFMRAMDEDTRKAIRLVIGVSSGADLKARIERSAEVINHVGRFGGGGFGHFNFLESVNIDELIK